MDKLLAMEVFVQVVDAGGFTRAAQQLQLPKATVSTLVQKLEKHLGAKLLHRTTRQLSLSADGAMYYERCLRILAEVRDSEEALSSSVGQAFGRLRVEAPNSLGNRLLAPALPDFFARYPDLQLELGCSDRAVDLIEEGVDCALRGGELADSSLIARRVGVLHFYTCAAPSYLAAHGEPQHPEDLHRHRCLNYFSARSGKHFPWSFTRGEQQLSLHLPGFFSTNNSDTYLQAALSGLGVAQMTSFVMQDYVRRGELQIVLPAWRSRAAPVHVVYPHNRHLSAKVRVFVEWLAQLLAGVPQLQAEAAL
ncbi:LysR family transcriptional regulator [Massilia sp. W12]|uniref:LysR family transcriptional regulator n=1 Tax=Massilia sp. W12 TaxID=3126507 RepID=UPI0030D38C61